MSSQDELEDLNRNDLSATRVFTLAVKFFGSSRPISSLDIRAELYGDLDDGTFRRQFLRDRTLLSSLGVIIVEAQGEWDDTRWMVDEDASYVQGEVLSPDDARILYVLCHDMTLDPSFPYRDELRLALFKISQVYGAAPNLQAKAEPSHDRKALAALVTAMSRHEAVSVRYTDAHGARSERLIAPFGSFGLRGRTYFVAARVTPEGTTVPDSLRTYRLDRFSRVKTTRPAIPYTVPEDFSVHDFERLPFQIGDTVGNALLDVGEDPSREVSRAMSTSGSVHIGNTWEVPYSSVTALASWCVAEDLVPQGPAGLVETWQATLHAVAQKDHHDAALSSYADRRPLRERRGGPAAIDTPARVRQLITLAGGLSKEGKPVTARQIAEGLDIPLDQARRLIMLMTMGSGESFDYLPVGIDDDYGEVFLMQGARFSMPHVRLTRAETLALSAALAELGVPADDPLAKTLSKSYAAPAFTQDDLAGALELPSSDSDGDDLWACSQAIADGKGLSFGYRPVSGGERTERRVVPLSLRRGDDSWYLDAYDLAREGLRVFRIDRMDAVSAIEAPDIGQALPTAQQKQTVIVRFGDPSYLDLFHWDDMEVVGREEGSTIVRMPYYGGSWLPRHLAACAGTASVDDATLAAEIHAVAARQDA